MARCHRFTILCAFAIAALWPGKMIIAGDLPRLAEVVQGLRQRANLFSAPESFYIECGWKGTDHPLLTDAEKQEFMSLVRSRDFTGLQKFRSRTIVARLPGYQYQLGKRGRRYYARIVNPLDGKFGKEGLTAVYEGTVGVEIQESANAIITKEPPPHAWQNWEYSELLHLDVYKDFEGLDLQTMVPPAKRPLLLPEDIERHEGQYSVVGLDSIDKSECIVLDKRNLAKFWLDPALGYAIRHVETYWADTTSHDLLRKMVTTMSEHQEVRPGLWLPRKILQELYTDPNHDSRTVWGMVAVRQTLDVTKMEFDTLTDEFFLVSIPKGAYVHDNVRQLKYVYQHSSEEPFTQAIEFARGRVQRSAWFIIALVAGIVAISILIWRLLPLRRGGRR